jgi:nucleoid DNA-binding protein
MAKGATPLSEGDLITEIHSRLTKDGADVSVADVRKFVKAFKEEVVDCLSNGYKVSLSGLLTITPTAKPGRKKGTKVRNPFDGTTKTLRADEPDKFRIKAKVSTAIVNNHFPKATTAAGQALVKQLKPAKKR